MALKKVEGEKIGMSSEAPKRHLPTIAFSETDIPDLKEWPIGKKYFLILEAELIGINKNEFGFENEKNKITGRFKVEKVDSIDSVDEKVFNKLITKVKNG